MTLILYKFITMFKSSMEDNEAAVEAEKKRVEKEKKKAEEEKKKKEADEKKRKQKEEEAAKKTWDEQGGKKKGTEGEGGGAPPKGEAPGLGKAKVGGAGKVELGDSKQGTPGEVNGAILEGFKGLKKRGAEGEGTLKVEDKSGGTTSGDGARVEGGSGRASAEGGPGGAGRESGKGQGKDGGPKTPRVTTHTPHPPNSPPTSPPSPGSRRLLHPPSFTREGSFTAHGHGDSVSRLAAGSSGEGTGGSHGGPGAGHKSHFFNEIKKRQVGGVEEEGSEDGSNRGSKAGSPGRLPSLQSIGDEDPGRLEKGSSTGRQSTGNGDAGTPTKSKLASSSTDSTSRTRMQFGEVVDLAVAAKKGKQ